MKACIELTQRAATVVLMMVVLAGAAPARAEETWCFAQAGGSCSFVPTTVSPPFFATGYVGNTTGDYSISTTNPPGSPCDIQPAYQTRGRRVVTDGGTSRTVAWLDSGVGGIQSLFYTVGCRYVVDVAPGSGSVSAGSLV